MKPSDALAAHRSTIRSVVQRCRAANPRVFGSVLRGEDQDGSDLDLLVGDLPPELRQRVLAEATPL